MYQLDLKELPANISNEIWYWCYNNNIGDIRQRVKNNPEFRTKIELSEDEAVLFTLKWL